MRADDPHTRGPRPVDDREELLAAYRESLALPEEVKARVRQRLLVAGAAPREPAPANPQGGARREPAAIDPRWWIAAAAILLLAFAALVLLSEQSSGIVASRRGLDGAAYSADDPSRPGTVIRREDPGARPTTTASSPQAIEERIPLRAAPPSGTAPAGGTTASPAPASADLATSTAGTMETQGSGPDSRPGSDRTPSQGPAPTLDLAAEKALLEDAWRALAAGDDQGARAALSRHRRDFAAGILSQERETLEVLLACTTSAPGAARRAARFRREHPQSPWKARLDAVCPEPAGPGKEP